MTTYMTTAPDGTVLHRESDRAYTHVVVTKFKDNASYGSWAYCGRLALAEKALKQARCCRDLEDARILPVGIK